MSRKKSRLTIQTTKSQRNRKRTDKQAPSETNTSLIKRRRPFTPLKSPFKSPFKSPLYKIRRTSQQNKRDKSDTNSLSFDKDIDPSKRPKSSKALKFSMHDKSEKLDTGTSVLMNVDILETESLDLSEIVEKVGSKYQDAQKAADVLVSDKEGEEVEQREAKYDINTDDVTQKITSLLPSVMKSLYEKNRLDLSVLSFFEQISENRFPLDNIAFLLWVEVVKWYQCNSTTEMRYTKETKTFWKLGWRLFGGRFINFMGGYKNHGENVLNISAKGKFSPESSDINFAVPDPKTLRTFNPYEIEGERKPGLYADVMDELSANLRGKSACMTFDGKKLKQGLTEESGDVDLLGFEGTLTLKDRQEVLQQNIEEINNMTECLTCCASSLKQMPDTYRALLKCMLLQCFEKITNQIIDVRAIKERKQYCKQKLIEKGGDSDWRKGKYVYAVSAIIAFIHDIDQFLEGAINIAENICLCVSFLNMCPYSVKDTVNLEEHDRYFDTDHQVGPSEDSRLIKQRSEQWSFIRKEAKVTGSTLFGAVGCDSLKKQKQHFEKVICGVPDTEPSEIVKKAMQHGTENEINAVATVVGRVLPVLEPDLVFCEEGCIKINSEDNNVFMVVSPDGSLRKNNSLNSTCVAVEIKCPVNRIHTEFPSRYLLQCLSEIEALNTDSLLYISWTKEESFVFKVERNTNIFEKAMKIAISIYGDKTPKRPSKLTEEQKGLKEEIIRESKKIKVIGRSRSCTAGNEPNILSADELSTSEVEELLSAIKTCYERHYELKRERATEAVVFLVADLNRSWEKDQIRCSPVAWFPKGYSLTTQTMGKIAESVHTSCHERGIHIPCESFDGQWHLLVVRSVDNKPLTAYQLQKDVWKEVESMTKSAIVSQLRALNKTPHWKFSCIVYGCTVNLNNESDNLQQKNVIEATNGGLLPQYYHRDSVTCKGLNEERDIVEESISLADAVPDTVRQSNDLVLSITEITDTLEKDAFSANIDENEWTNELDNIQYDIDHDTPDNDTTRTEDVDTVDNRENIVGNINYQNNDPKSYLTLEDMKHIIALFQTTKNCNRKVNGTILRPKFY